MSERERVERMRLIWVVVRLWILVVCRALSLGSGRMRLMFSLRGMGELRMDCCFVFGLVMYVQFLIPEMVTDDNMADPRNSRIVQPPTGVRIHLSPRRPTLRPLFLHLLHPPPNSYLNPPPCVLTFVPPPSQYRISSTPIKHKDDLPLSPLWAIYRPLRVLVSRTTQ